jgi:hypothetical protein
MASMPVMLRRQPSERQRQSYRASRRRDPGTDLHLHRGLHALEVADPAEVLGRRLEDGAHAKREERQVSGSICLIGRSLGGRATHAILPDEVPASRARSLSSNRRTSVSRMGMKTRLRVTLDEAMSTSDRLIERSEGSLGDSAEGGSVEIKCRKAADAGFDCRKGSGLVGQPLDRRSKDEGLRSASLTVPSDKLPILSDKPSRSGRR